MDDIKKTSYELYLTTLNLNTFRENFKPKTCSNYRGVYSTIISRAYYSAYSYVSFWLYKKHKFRPKKPYVLKREGKDPISEHKQVSDKLKKYNSSCAIKLVETKRLRTTADYYLSEPLSKKDCDAAISNMKHIFNTLKF